MSKNVSKNLLFLSCFYEHFFIPFSEEEIVPKTDVFSKVFWVCIFISKQGMFFRPILVIKKHPIFTLIILSQRQMFLEIFLGVCICATKKARRYRNVGPEHRVGMEGQVPVMKNFIWPLEISIFSQVTWCKMTLASFVYFNLHPLSQYDLNIHIINQ